ncbi:MAG: SDR family oxidoreductase [Saprospiraceae bacterium]|nr:SDR family oxidoreductase [Saprospiraceae bacterium]
MILVTGATGALGAATIDFLLEKTPASNIAALVRDEAKAAPLKEKGIEIRIGNYDDVPSMVKAFQGVDKLLFVSGSEIENRSEQHRNVVDAAKQANVGHVVYTSFVRRNETETSPITFVAKSHLDAEAALKASGLSYTLLKNGLYMDMLPYFLGQQVIETGVVFQPAGDGQAAFVLRNDLAEAAANVLTTEGHEGKSYDLPGAVPITYSEVAATLSKIAGKEIAYISPTQEVYRAEMTKAGVPEMYIGMFGAFAEAIRQGEFEDAGGDLPKLLGRQPVAPADYLKQVYGN